MTLKIEKAGLSSLGSALDVNSNKKIDKTYVNNFSSSKEKTSKTSEDENQEAELNDVTAELDVNGDGVITDEEVEQYQKRKSNNDKTNEIDANGDGIITDDEVNDYSSKKSPKALDTSKSGVTFNEAAIKNDITTTVDDYDPSVNYIPTLSELQNVPFTTNIPALEENVFTLGLGGNAGIRGLDDATKKVLNNVFKGEKILFCKDELDGTTAIRTIRLDNNKELRVEVDCWGQTSIEISEYSGDPDEPKYGDKTAVQSYYELDDGYFALSAKKYGTYREITDEEDDFVFNLSSIGVQYAGDDKISPIFYIYDKNGKEITKESDPETYEKYLAQAQEVSSAFKYI